MNEEPLDLRRIASILTKGWWLIGLTLVAGNLAGFVVGFREPIYLARASVLLPPSAVNAEGQNVRNIATEVNIAANGNVLQAAGRAVDPPLGVQTMRKRIKVSALTGDILQVRARAPSPEDAVLLADAVANEYVAAATDAASKTATTSIAALQAEAARLERRVVDLTGSINSETGRLNGMALASPERLRQAAVIDSLRLDVTDASRQLASVNTRVADSQLLDRLNRQGTRLLAPATRPTNPSGLPTLSSTVGGGLVGALFGALVLLVRDRRDGRLRRRSDIAAVMAAPILVSLEVPRRTTQRRCRSMLESWEPRPVTGWMVRRAFSHLGIGVDEPTCEIVVVGLPGDRTAPLVALQLAVLSASSGLQTALAVTTSDPAASLLRSACNVGQGRSEVRPRLSAHGDLSSSQARDQIAQAQVVVSFAIAGVDPIDSVWLGKRKITTLAVSSGQATADSLAAVALTYLDGGQPMVGILLANSDPSDQTNGGLVGGSPARPAASSEHPLGTSPVVPAIGPGAALVRRLPEEDLAPRRNSGSRATTDLAIQAVLHQLRRTHRPGRGLVDPPPRISPDGSSRPAPTGSSAKGVKNGIGNGDAETTDAETTDADTTDADTTDADMNDADTNEGGGSDGERASQVDPV